MQKIKDTWGTPVNAIEIQGRRELIFRYKSLGLTPQEMLPLINKKYSTSIDTIRRDLRDIRLWLPSLLYLKEGDGDKSLEQIIGFMQLAQGRLVQLMYQADNDSAKVGACKGLADVAFKEASLRMDAGQLARQPFKLLSASYIEQDLAGLDERAVGAIIENFMDEESRKLRQLDQNIEGSEKRGFDYV